MKALDFAGFDALLGDHGDGSAPPSKTDGDLSGSETGPEHGYNAARQLSCDKAESFIADAYQKSGEVRRLITDESAMKARLIAAVKFIDTNMTGVQNTLHEKMEILKQGFEKGIKIFEDLEDSDQIVSKTYEMLGAVENHIKVLHMAAAVPWRKAAVESRSALTKKAEAEMKVDMADAKLEALQEQLDEVHKQASSYADCVDEETAEVSKKMLKSM